MRKSTTSAAPDDKTHGRRSKRKNEIVLGAAEKSFVQLGYASTSVDAIAELAGVSKRTVYSNFKTKQALFEEVIRKRAAAVVPAEIPAALLEGDPEATLFQISVAFLKAVFSPESIALYQTVVADSRQFPEIGAMMADGPILRSQMVFDAYFRKEARKGLMQFPDLDLAAAQFVSLLKTNVHLRLLFNQPADTSKRAIEESARASIHLFLHGALPRAPGALNDLPVPKRSRAR
jgi:TetR/AcrR family transcriptional regulator, mexJK operon transcriptional repressor